MNSETTKLSDVMTLNEDGEVVPRADIAKIFDGSTFPRESSWEYYERWCKLHGHEKDILEWARSHGMFAEDDPNDAA